MSEETKDQRSERILQELRKVYPEAQTFDLDGNGTHFVAEVEPTKDHPEYDRAIEVIIKSKPHKHLKMTQEYRVLSGTLRLHIDDQIVNLSKDEAYTVLPEKIHWAESDNECWVELHSKPGWTKEDHIPVDIA